jgi:hypothetical protein
MAAAATTAATTAATAADAAGSSLRDNMKIVHIANLITFLIIIGITIVGIYLYITKEDDSIDGKKINEESKVEYKINERISTWTFMGLIIVTTSVMSYFLRGAMGSIKKSDLENLLNLNRSKQTEDKNAYLAMFIIGIIFIILVSKYVIFDEYIQNIFIEKRFNDDEHKEKNKEEDEKESNFGVQWAKWSFSGLGIALGCVFIGFLIPIVLPYLIKIIYLFVAYSLILSISFLDFLKFFIQYIFISFGSAIRNYHNFELLRMLIGPYTNPIMFCINICVHLISIFLYPILILLLRLITILPYLISYVAVLILTYIYIIGLSFVLALSPKYKFDKQIFYTFVSLNKNLYNGLNTILKGIESVDSSLYRVKETDHIESDWLLTFLKKFEMILIKRPQVDESHLTLIDNIFNNQLTKTLFDEENIFSKEYQEKLYKLGKDEEYGNFNDFVNPLNVNDINSKPLSTIFIFIVIFLVLTGAGVFYFYGIKSAAEQSSDDETKHNPQYSTEDNVNMISNQMMMALILLIINVLIFANADNINIKVT